MTIFFQGQKIKRNMTKKFPGYSTKSKGTPFDVKSFRIFQNVFSHISLVTFLVRNLGSN